VTFHYYIKEMLEAGLLVEECNRGEKHEDIKRRSLGGVNNGLMEINTGFTNNGYNTTL
jgi:hypothetical protein